MTLFNMEDTGPEIFKNRDVLKDRYYPDTIVGRDREKKALQRALRPVLRGNGSPDNIFVSGPTGTGKTALVRAAMNQIRGNDDIDVRTVWLNCKPVGGETQLMLEITNQFRESGNKVSTTGFSEKQAQDLLFGEIDECEESTVLVFLDELDTLGDLGQFLYHLPRAHEFGVETEVGIVATSNEPDFLRNLPIDVRETLTDKHITFREYDANDIREVLKQRAVLAFPDTTIDENGEVVSPVLENATLTFAAAKGSKSSGSARMARDVLRDAGDIALNKGDSTIRVEHAEEAVREYHKSRMVDTISEWRDTAQLVLYALITLEADGQDSPRTSVVHERYKSLSDNGGYESVSRRQTLSYLQKFDREGVTEAVNHQGAGGNFTNHRLQYEPDVLLQGIGDAIDIAGTHSSVKGMVPASAD